MEQESGGAPISWKSIVAALKSKHVGEPALADEVNKKYCQDHAEVEQGMAIGV